MWDQALCFRPSQGGGGAKPGDVVYVKAVHSRPHTSAANALAEKRKGGGERDRAALAESTQNTEVERPDFTPLAAV